jgi:hypothetical protein
MPQTDIAYDNGYNRKLVNLLREMDEKHWKKAGNSYSPTSMGERLGSFHGEQPKIGGGSHADQKYVQPGNSPCYPPAHFHTGMATRRKKVGGDFDLGRAANDVISAVAPYAMDALMAAGLPSTPAEGGRLARAKSVGRRVKRGRKTMFEGLPDKNKVAQVPHKRKGRMVKGSPEAKAWAEKMRKLRAAKKSGGAVTAIANTLAPVVQADSLPLSNAEVGAGRKRKSKKTGGLSMPSLNSIMEVAKPVAKELGKVALDKGVDYLKKKISGAGISGGRAKRAEIVKKVMKERNLKMIEASKYVKTHGLY